LFHLAWTALSRASVSVHPVQDPTQDTSSAQSSLAYTGVSQRTGLDFCVLRQFWELTSPPGSTTLLLLPGCGLWLWPVWW
jgi:hypothetical protein